MYLTSIIRANNGQHYIRLVKHNREYEEIPSTIRYWRNPGKHWVESIEDATGYPSERSANRSDYGKYLP